MAGIQQAQKNYGKPLGGIGAAALVAAIAAFVIPHEGTGPQKTDPATGAKVSVAYPDPGYGAALPTICQGHTKGVFMGQTATPGQCRVFLEEDISRDVLPCLERLVKAPVTQGQAVALGDFVFNAGCGAFGGSTLLKKLNAGDCKGAAAEFGRWVKSNGKTLPGLVKRREAEARLFLEGCNPAPETRSIK